MATVKIGQGYATGVHMVRTWVRKERPKSSSFGGLWTLLQRHNGKLVNLLGFTKDDNFHAINMCASFMAGVAADCMCRRNHRQTQHNKILAIVQLTCGNGSRSAFIHPAKRRRIYGRVQSLAYYCMLFALFASIHEII